MQKIVVPIVLFILTLWAFAILPLQAKDRPTIVVRPFTVATGVSWPYDMSQMAAQTMGELLFKDRKKYDIYPEAPAGRTDVYTLDGEVLEWKPGNRAERVMVGYGTGRETAKIHYWLTDQSGKKVFEHEDIIRAQFLGNQYAPSVGQLARPFGDKIAARLKEAKL